MRSLILSALIFASAFQTATGQTYTSGNYQFTLSNNQATITRYTGGGGAVAIPSLLNSYLVVSIGNSAFKSSGLVSVTIPNSVTSIGAGAFHNCYSLTSITIPSSVTSIGSGAFNGCTSLTSITLVDGLPAIGSGWFAGIPVTSIIIPNSVTSIGSSAFNGCTGLTSITIPSSVTSIGEYAFNGCTGLTSITIPNSVTSIGSGAFNGCSGLTSVTMPVSYIGQTTQIGISGQVASDYIINALANNDAFVTAVANKIKGTAGNYGIATQSGLSFAITTAIEPLATKTELTSSLAQSRTDGINSVLSNPNLWTLYTTSQIQNMAVGDLVLTKDVGGTFTLNYDIEQSADLQTWTTYAPLSLPLTGLPTDKAFVRIKMINSAPNSPPSTAAGSNMN